MSAHIVQGARGDRARRFPYALREGKLPDFTFYPPCVPSEMSERGSPRHVSRATPLKTSIKGGILRRAVTETAVFFAAVEKASCRIIRQSLLYIAYNCNITFAKALKKFILKVLSFFELCIIIYSN